MNIVKEADLIPIISANSIVINNDTPFAASEVPSGYGIADLVFYSLNRKILDFRLEKKISPITSYNTIKLLMELNNLTDEAVSLTFIKSQIGAADRDEVLTYLIENNYLVADGAETSYFKKGLSYNIGLKEVVAIEAKLSNWKRGLYQAYRYKHYANKSYLALYSQFIHRALPHIEAFKLSNVGLIEVRDDGIDIHFDPQREDKADNIFRALAYENLLADTKDFLPSDQKA